jgi:hypothetical protein
MAALDLEDRILARIAAFYAIVNIPEEYLPFGISVNGQSAVKILLRTTLRSLRAPFFVTLKQRKPFHAPETSRGSFRSKQSLQFNQRTRGTYLPLLESQRPAVIARAQDGNGFCARKKSFSSSWKRAVSRRLKSSPPRRLHELSPVSPFATQHSSVSFLGL